MKERIKVFLLSLVLLIGIAGNAEKATAQSAHVNGTVHDAQGNPVIGASVVVKGTTIGTSTNVDGSYSVEAPADAVLTFSFLGMAPIDVSVNGQSQLNVRLAEGDQQIQEIVVTAMGIKRSEKSIGYAATTVAGDAISQTRSTDALSSLQGKIAGVQISSASSTPGAANSIIVRGVSSLSGNNQPLFVVDGVPIQNNALQSLITDRTSYSMGNGANLVNPDNIESLTVLKGAAATALYGSRAANGVVLITTKSGRKNSPMTIEINAGMQVSEVTKLPELQNSFGQGWYGLKTIDENGSWGPAFDGRKRVYGPVYNNSQLVKPYVALPTNLRDFFDYGTMYSTSATLSGGTDNSTYHAAVSNISEDGIMPQNFDTHNVTTMSFNSSYSPNKYLDVSSSVNIANQETNTTLSSQGVSVIDGVLEMPRDISIVDLQDLTNPFNQPAYYFTPYGISNPYYALENSLGLIKQNKVYGKFQLDIKPITDLTISYRLGYDYSDTESKIAESKIDVTGTPNEGVNQPGFVDVQFIRRYELDHTFMAAYNKRGGDFSGSATVGVNINERGLNSTKSGITDLSIPSFFGLNNTAGIPTVSEIAQLRRLVGVFADVQVGWKDLVFVDLTARNDWSSTLPLKNNNYFYPGVTASFVFTEVVPKNDILSFGKLRAAFGKTGNDAGVYLTEPGFVAGQGYNAYSAAHSFPINGINAYKYSATLGSSELAPEMTTEWEFGVNAQFFDGRIGIDAAYYDRVSDNQIFALDIDPGSGYLYQVTNLGEIANRGVELLLTATPLKISDFSWDVTFNFSKNTSEVLSLPAQYTESGSVLRSFSTTADRVEMRAEVGKPLGTFWAQSSVKDPDGRVVCDPTTGMPLKTTDPVETGYNINPDWEGGVGTTLRYKGLSIGAALDVRMGGWMFSRSKSLMAFTGNSITTLYNNRYTYIVPNSVNQVLDANGKVAGYAENTTPIQSIMIADGSESLANGFDYSISDYMLERTALKLRNVTISYDLPSKWLSKIYVKGLRVSLVGTNLLTWTPKENVFIDPEGSTEGIDLDGKFGEMYINPSSRKFGFNIQLKF